MDLKREETCWRDEFSDTTSFSEAYKSVEPVDQPGWICRTENCRAQDTCQRH